MPYIIVRNDITRMNVDAVVNAANESLLGGGGVDGAIHRAAGPELLAECRTLGGCKTGMAKLTKGYRLPCKYVIHTVGPVWRGGGNGEAALLASCYRESLKLALENGCESVAFPLISSGVYGYPKDLALKTAAEVIREFLSENDMLVYMVIFDRGSLMIGRELYRQVTEYIDDRYVSEHRDSEALSEQRRMMRQRMAEADLCEAEFCKAAEPAEDKKVSRKPLFAAKEKSAYREDDLTAAPLGGQLAPSARSLEEMLKKLDEGFSRTVIRLIDEKNMTDTECYKKANLDRKLFSKLRSDPEYRPSKRTAVALALALELTLDETRDLLARAGYALSPASRFDIIIEYFIRNGSYDIDTINETLFEFDEQLLGA